MSEIFDGVVEGAWGTFEERLRREVRRASDRPLVIELDTDAGGGAAPYVQFVSEGDVVLAEASSNRFLGRHLRLAKPQKKSLRALGWCAPGDASPNVRATRDESNLLAGVLVGTLRHVYGVVHPDFLTWRGGCEAGTADDGHEFVVPTSPDELRACVGDLLEVHLGEEVASDSDGDFVYRNGDFPVWVRVLEEHATIRLFSYVATGVHQRQARIEADVLNRQNCFVKFHLVGDCLQARLDVLGSPFVGEHVLGSLLLLEGALDAIGRDAAARTSGRMFFENGQATA